MREAAIDGNQLEILIDLQGPKPYSETLSYDLGHALGNDKPDIVKYILNERPSLLKREDDKLLFLDEALQGGNPATINHILTLTKLKFSIDQLWNVAVSGNPALLARFERQFPDQFSEKLTKCEYQLRETGDLTLAEALVKHGFEKWERLLFFAELRQNFGLLDLVVRNIGPQATYDLLKADNIAPRGADLIFLEYVKNILES